MRLVIFDADGTLVDSQATIHEAMRLTFIEYGHEELPIEATRTIIGLTLNQAIAKLLNRPVDDEVDSMAEFYKQRTVELLKIPAMHAQFYHGISDVIAELSEQPETLLAIATGKSRRGLNNLIETHNLTGKLIAWKSADDCPSKPHPAMILECCEQAGCDPSQSVMIGDASYDMEMAVNAGALALGVSWGYQSVETLKKTGAQMIVDYPSDLPKAIDAIFEKAK